MLRFRNYALAILALWVGSASQAEASLITDQVDFSVSEFQYSGPLTPIAPIDTISGSFTVTFDPLVYTSPTTTGLSLNSLSFSPLCCGVAFDNFLTDNNGNNIPRFGIGTHPDPTSGLGSYQGTNGFIVEIANIATTHPQIAYAEYTLAGVDGFGSTDSFPTNSSVRVTQLSSLSAVPLPAGLPMFGAAVLGLGAFGLRRYRDNSFSAAC